MGGRGRATIKIPRHKGYQRGSVGVRRGRIGRLRFDISDCTVCVSGQEKPSFSSCVVYLFISTDDLPFGLPSDGLPEWTPPELRALLDATNASQMYRSVIIAQLHEVVFLPAHAHVTA
jgi:hypothetical protein